MVKTHKLEFSKVITVIGLAMWLIVNIFGMVMIVITLDLTSLAYIEASVDAVVAVIVSFYFWKTRADNQIKLKYVYKLLGIDETKIDVSCVEPTGQ